MPNPTTPDIDRPDIDRPGIDSPDIDRIVRQLAVTFDGADHAAIEQLVKAEAERFESAAVQQYIEILVAKRVRADLRQRRADNDRGAEVKSVMAPT